jgi:phage shock protein PspC (stress-responsive transcriptional regulator)
MSEHITHSPEVKRLERASHDKMIAGVCGGLGRYFDVNPTVFRLGFVVLTLLGGAGALLYIAAILVIPREGEHASIAERTLAERRDRPVRLVALAILGVAIVALLSRASTWPSAGAAWTLAAIAGLVVLWTSTKPRRRWLVAAVTFAAAVLAAIAVAVVAAFAWFDVSLNDGLGDRTYAPASVADVRHDYKLGVGNLKLDLSRVPTNREVHVKAHVGIGELRVIVPQHASVVVDSHVKAGSIDALDRHDDGRNARIHVGSGEKLYLDTRVGAGHIDVVRAG